MADKRIEDFATLEEAQDDDLLLVSSDEETYNIKVKTIKEAVQGDADRAEAAAEAASEAAEAAASDAATAVATANSAMTKANAAQSSAATAAANTATAASAASAAADSAADAAQSLNDATEAVDSINEFAEDFQSMKAELSGKVDNAYVDDGYLYMTSNDEVVVGPLGPFSGTGGGGGGSSAGSTIRITNRMPSRAFSVMNTDTVQILYNWTSVDTEDDTPIGDGSATWRVNGTKVATLTVAQGNNSFDVTRYLAASSANTVKLTIEDAYGNSKTFTWTVTVTAYTLTWNLGTISTHGSLSVSARLVPTGEGVKTIHVSVDGEEIYDNDVETTGRSITVVIDAQDHGAHVVEAWLEATVNGEIITTPKLRHVGIWTEVGETTPIIAVYQNTMSIPQFSTGSIQYMVYDPVNLTSSITLRKGYETLNTLTVDRTIQTWAYKATASGNISLSIVCGDESETIAVTVTSLGYDINAITEALVMDIDPTGHTNSETNHASFGYKDGSGTNHPFTFSDNFDWVNGGFQLDERGVTAFVVKRGTYVTADRSLFNDNPSVSGKEIKFMFKAVNVRDYDAEIVDCTSGGVGLLLQAQQAVLSSELKSITIPYCEDRLIELDVNIEAANENKLAYVSLSGVPSRAFAYTASDNWQQVAPKNLKIGSDDCDVWIYRMKLYSSSLTRYEVLDNYIADCGDTEEMVARFERNNIFNPDGSININALAAQNPKLRIIKISGERFTTGKSDPVNVNIEHIFTDGGEAHNFTATDVVMKVQGTSSAAYGEAAYNVDLDFSGVECSGFVLDNGETVREYAMTENSIPVSYYNIKLNVASSENANNVLFTDEYNTFQPWLSAARRADSRVRDTVEGHPCVAFFTNTSSASIVVGSRLVAPNETIFYGCGDMVNSKKNYAVFGQNSTAYPMQCCVEFNNNIAAQCLWQSDDLTGENWDGDNGGNFEFRYPKNPTAAMKAKFQEVLSWVVSCNTEAATGDALPTAAHINGTTYTNDTAAYRAAKFVDEFEDYFVKDSLLYHYLFTERHTMIDSRSKNTFLSYEPDPDHDGEYRWNICKNYDDDTADGNDNEGGLTFTYGIEDTDNVKDKPAFNASTSVLWCNIRDYMGDDLTALYADLKAAGAWKASRILAKFENYQGARPEACYVEDAWVKYILPYTNNGNSAYIAMLQGKKTDQRTQYETYQEPYMDSKYMTIQSSKTEAITFRANTPNTWSGVTPNGDLTLKIYADAYVNVNYANTKLVKIRAKRGQTISITNPYDENFSDTEIYIGSAANISEIGSIAGLYCQYIDLGYAKRLRKLIAGANEDNYSNGNMTEISVGTNPLLEYLDLQGTPALVQDLDLSHLTSLKYLYLTNSGITGVTFAPNAPLIEAELCALTSLVARNLPYLETFTMDPINLTTIWVEECPAIDVLSIIQQAPSLNKGRVLDVDWEVDSADVLTRLARLAGLSESGALIDTFVLTGSCAIGAASQDELDAIEDAFPNLAFTYDELVPQYTVTFKNYDGTVLNTQSVRKFGAALNPITAGLIQTPVRPSSVDKVYTYTGWDKNFNYILDDTVVTASYGETTRTYSIKWWNGSTLVQSATVEAYGSASYTGAELTPTSGAIWMGWDTPTSNVTADINTHAVFVTPTLPDVVATNFDYLYSDDPNDNSGYTLAEFYGIIATGNAKNYFSVGDLIKIVPNTTAFADNSIICQVAGFKHFRRSDNDQMADVVFVMKGLMNATHTMNSSNTNAGGWASSGMRTYLNNTIYPNLPRQWQSMIKTVDVLSSIGGTSETISTSEDKLFLLSNAEVGFNATVIPYKNEQDPEAEQVTFSLFTDNNSRIKKTYNGGGTANIWWLRSPYSSSSTSFMNVNTYGGSNTNGAGNSNGVAFGFCI